MPVITNQFTIDAQQAIATLNSVQQSFQTHNAAVGAVSSQYATFNRSGKNVLATFTQINDAGKKITTTLKDAGRGYEAVAVKIGTASNAQRRFAAEMERQAQLADRLAKSLAGVPAGPSSTPTLTPGAINPALIGQTVQSYGRITTEQVKAAAAANGLNAAQTKSLLSIVSGAGKATGAIERIKSGADNLKGRFDELGKIAFATGIYRGLSLIQLGITEGIKSAAQYSRQIGLIQTLAVGTTDSYATWDNAIRQVAQDLALPAAEVAAATYDALSNQVIKTTKDIGLLSVAGTLARNTNSNITDSLNVLSSILNTYGTSAGTAQQISDELFKTVDLGRVRINELNGVIGRSAGIAKTAGVSLRELEAGLIVQTQAGLDSAESATLLNNVFSQLIKPNDALTAQFHKMGFEGGQAAVATLGFAGVMRQLAAAAKETDEGIATFFPEIRGLRGAATFAGEGIDKFEQSLRALESSQGANSKAAQILKENLGQSLIDEGQRIKNFFTVDLGQKALEAISFLSVQIGGLDNAIKLMFPTLVAVGSLFALTFGGFAIAKALTTAFTLVDGIRSLLGVVKATDAAVAIMGTSFSKVAIGLTLGIGTAVAVATTLYTVIKAIDSASIKASESIRAGTRIQVEALKKAAEESAAAQISAFNKSTDEVSHKYGAFTAEMKKANNTIKESTNEISKDIATRLKNSFEVIVGIARQGLNKLEAEQKKAADNSTKIDKDRASVTDDFEKKQFDRRIKAFDDLRKHNESLGRNQYDFPGQDPVQQIVKLTNKRNDRLRALEATAIGKGDIDAGRTLLNEIQENIDKLDSFRAENPGGLRRGRGQNSIRGRGRNQGEFDGLNVSSASELKNFLDLTEKLKATDQARTVELAKQIEIEKQQAAALDDVLAKTTQFVQKGVFDKQGNLLDKFATDPAAALDKLEALQAEAFKAAESLKGVTDPLVNVQYQAALEEIKKTFADQSSTLQEQISIAQIEKRLTQKRQAYEETSTAAKAAVSEIITILKDEGLAIDSNLTKLKAAGKAMSAQASTAFGSSSTVNRLLAGFSGEGLSDSDAVKLQNLVGNLNQTLSAQGPKNIGLGQSQLDQIRQLITQKAPSFKIIDPDDANKQITYLQNIDRMEKVLIETGKQQQTNTANKAQLEKAQSSLKSLNDDMLKTLQEANPALDTFNTSLDHTVNMTENVDKLGTAFLRLGTSIRDAKKFAFGLGDVGLTAPSGPNPEPHAKGGSVGLSWLGKFISGGFANGTDVIPAMLSKREFVVRAPMADKYYSQLVAMNAGTAPIYRSQGGPVSTTSVGDIHINVSGGAGNSLAMAKQVAGHIRRGIKQGTLRID